MLRSRQETGLDRQHLWDAGIVHRRLTRIILEFEIYAPYRFPGASVRFVPFHAVIPPPQALFASVTFSNHLIVNREHYSRDCPVIKVAYAVPKPNKSEESLARSYKRCNSFAHTISLSKDDTVHNIGATVAPSVPGILVACKSAPVK